MAIAVAARPPCPECGAPDPLRIVYGNPGPELGASAARGEIALGGDVLFGGEPAWQCRTCGHEFGLFAGSDVSANSEWK